MIRLDKYQVVAQHLRSIFHAVVFVYLCASIPWPISHADEGRWSNFFALLFPCVVLGSVVLRGARRKDVKNDAPHSKKVLAAVSGGGKHCPLKHVASSYGMSNESNKPHKTNPKPKTGAQPSLSLPSKQSSVDVLTNPSLLPDNMFNAICTFLNPRDVTTGLVPASKSARRRVDANAVWLQYWFRDYGDTLLEWDVARNVLEQEVESKGGNQVELKRALSQKLSSLKSIKDFYFVFGECWLNFILAGINNPKTKCLVGLHGHVFDFGAFAPYHPGLVDRIVQDCGQDATDAFETIRHSRPARVLASMTCLIMSKRRHDGSQYLTHAKEINGDEREAVFRQSNTRPPRSGRDEAKRLLPRVPEAGRPATISRTRAKFDQDKSEKENMLPPFRDFSCRIYYNPIKQNWFCWNCVRSAMGRPSQIEAL